MTSDTSVSARPQAELDAFLRAACVPREGSHASGTLTEASERLARTPDLAETSIHAAAALGHPDTVRRFLARDPALATERGGPYGWDALTHLCFSRFLRLDRVRSPNFAATALALLDAGADPNAGFNEPGNAPTPEWECVLYGAAGVAHDAAVSRLLVERGADVNDPEVCYHTPEGYDNAAMVVLLESKRLTADSLAMMLLRKADWHDLDGVRLLLEHGADPNRTTQWGNSALHNAVLSDNRVAIVQLMLEHGADPLRENEREAARGHGRSAVAMAAWAGRRDLLDLFASRGVPIRLEAVGALVAACALDDSAAVRALSKDEPALVDQLHTMGGDVLVAFARVGNVDGMRQLLALGTPVDATVASGNGYFDIADRSTALHAAAWRAQHDAVRLLLERGASVNARDANGRTPLALAIRACVDSYWTQQRSPESVRAAAGRRRRQRAGRTISERIRRRRRAAARRWRARSGPCKRRHMRTALLAAAIAALSLQSLRAQDDVARWERQAQNVTIIRDTWGIPHTYGHTDADAVFGMVYAQAEDDFNRVEMNFVNALGRAAETEGESAIWKDLRMKLFIDPDSLKVMYARSPGFLQALMTAWADGLNYYLHTHPRVTPKVIRRFEPWMALAFSEGSIGGDIERISLRGLAEFYGRERGAGRADVRPGDGAPADGEPRGSNGIAIAPSRTANGHTLLLINPHTSFFFRAELGMASDEGLNAYGASTWGQFFVYQGFNEHVGWMHTSSNVDNIDEYAETIEKRGNGWAYKYGDGFRPVLVDTIAVPFRTASGMSTRSFTVYRTHHGPVVREAGGKWVSVRLMQEPVKALTQSYTRTKARDYTEYRRSMELHTNSSNNTIFASGGGDIVYFHANFIPKRDTSFDWSRPVDGSNPATEWGELMSIDESPLVVNPPNGWVYNTNNWPYSAAGPGNSPKRSDFPAYVDDGGENFRGIHAMRVLGARKTFTLETLRAAAFDSYLTGFAALLPPLFEAYDALPASDPARARVAEQIAVLRAWDMRWGVSSVPTSLAVFWGEELGRRVAPAARAAGTSTDEYMVTRATAAERIAVLAAASDTLVGHFGTWRTPWGEINRFQRLTDDIEHPFTDAGPSIPVAFTSARWGSLASFGARSYRGSKKIYGTSGNSFVAVVDFGPDSVRAIAVTAGGESGDPASPHFNDQAERYATGNLRPVYFYRPDVRAHAERTYHPGE